MGKLFPVNIENEQKLISYFLNNPDEVVGIDAKNFIHKNNQDIVNGILEFSKSKRVLTFNFETLLVFIKRINPEFNSKILYEITEAYSDFSNIEFCKKQLKNDYLQYVIADKLEVDLLAETTNRGYLNPKKIEKTAQEILEAVSRSDDYLESIVQPVESLIDNYKNELNKRFEGKNIRTLGYDELDRGVTKPAEPGQVTTIFGDQGSGKTTFGKNIENRLVDRGVCVVSINTESGEFSALDLMYCIKTKTDRSVLKLSNKDDQVKQYVESKLSDVFERPNHIMIQQPTMNFQQIRQVIRLARKVFKGRGVLPEDEYMVLLSDLISDFEEYSSEKPDIILEANKEFDNLVQEEKIHGINIIQANENKLRDMKIIKNPEDLDYYQLTKTDVYGGASFARKAKLMIAIQRPINQKILNFPTHEDRELWINSEDIMNVYSVKVNEGPGFFAKFLFDKDTGIVAPYIQNTELEEKPKRERIPL